MHHPTDSIAHIMAFVIPIVEYLMERDIAEWIRHEGSIRLLVDCEWTVYHEIV